MIFSKCRASHVTSLPLGDEERQRMFQKSNTKGPTTSHLQLPAEVLAARSDSSETGQEAPWLLGSPRTEYTSIDLHSALFFTMAFMKSPGDYVLYPGGREWNSQLPKESPLSAGQLVSLWLYLAPHLPSWKNQASVDDREWEGRMASPSFRIFFFLNFKCKWYISPPQSPRWGEGRQEGHSPPPPTPPSDLGLTPSGSPSRPQLSQQRAPSGAFLRPSPTLLH